MNTIMTQFNIKISHMKDSLASTDIRLIKPKETYPKDLVRLE